MLSSILFAMILLGGFTLFTLNFKTILSNLKLAHGLLPSDQSSIRWKKMFSIAIGQSKMKQKPISGILHIFVYVGFIIVNIEMLEIVLDGLIGSHRILSFLPFYGFVVGMVELFALSVIVACVIFLIRRNFLKISRFQKPELNRWPRLDANLILLFEISLMLAFFTMNASDAVLQSKMPEHYHPTQGFILSSILMPLLSGLSVSSLIFVERFAWWFHIVGILVFLNYIPYSKHFHVFLAFPNVYFSKLKPRAYLPNMESITREVKIAMGLLQDDGQTPPPTTFGAKDIVDLEPQQLMNAYACTECGRCTDQCPANLTGKKLSPRKVMMDTRDRIEAMGKSLVGKKSKPDSPQLFERVTTEELWACTTCNACTEACPVEIDPLSIIHQLRRYHYMETSAAPATLANAITNIENNGAPWQFSAEDRGNWAEEIFNGEQKIEVQTMAQWAAMGQQPEYLFWVGSAGSFDRRSKKVSADFARILNHLGISFGILGAEESDSGDLAKRSGNEFTFQMQALMNIETLKLYNVNRIITCDPHEFNILKNEYSELGGVFEVEHHSQFLQRMIEEGKLKIPAKLTDLNITFHDPCYLGRGNGEYLAPRQVLEALGLEINEMNRNKSTAMCCGAGGGQMFKEAEKGDREIFVARSEEALQTGCNTVVTACPFCMTMLTDGLKYHQKEAEVSNFDLVELVVKALKLN